MTIYKNYLLAHTIQEALHALDTGPGSSRLIAGGTDLLLDLQQGRHPPVDLLVDVTRIPELSCLEIRENRLFIGAAVPLAVVNRSPLVKAHAEALVEASGLVGGPQVRNSATLGGNVGHALPAADGTIALVALGAQAQVASPDGLRQVPMLDLFKGPGRSALDGRREMLVGFSVPLSKPGQGSAFVRIMRPQGVALPIINMAAWIQADGDRVSDIRISVGPAGPTPQRGYPAETIIKGNRIDPERVRLAVDALLSGVQFRTSPQRATAQYRQHLSGFLLEEVLEKAWQRAKDSLSVGEEAVA